ncbi:MAG: CDP-diacylglycerol--serine O-phosphatidyltransferase [Deltaproteobacteria bacterium]|nr:MAG: CDP-diacylglycerol--serine O-phosphatidyltransferase [Deltaproteobacteria bacterium]
MSRFRKKKDSKKRRVPLLPNLITTMSLFFGLYSIYYSLNSNFYRAGVFILIAAFMDGIDGRVARVTGTTSLFGKEYDSLSDLVAFGVAPALMVYLWGIYVYARLGWLTTFLFVACGALRLARFNTMESSTITFTGLPIPMAAILLATTIMLGRVIGPVPPVVILVMVYILSYMMVSNIMYPSFKHMPYLKAHPFQLLVAGVLLIMVIAAAPEVMLFILVSIFVAAGPLYETVRFVKGYKKERSDGRDEAVAGEDSNL